VGDLDIKTSSNLNAVLLDLSAKGRSVDRMLPIIAEMLVGAVQDVIEAEGPGWQELADSTKRSRRGSSYKILQDTGVAAASIAAQYGSTYAEAVDGTSYFFRHIKGGPNLPVRDWTKLGPFEAPLLDEVAEMLVGQF